ncbi:MAG TPA: LysO family transporter [Thermoplasmata archaeon]|nr:LysO family transporter [Thermoplasmata archaeon]
MIDVYLYIAFAGGVVAGHLTGWRSPWVDRAILADIVALVFFLGVLLASLPATRLLVAIPLALGLVALMLAVTIAVTFALPRRPHVPGTGRPPRPLGVFIVVALVVGYGAGRLVSLPGQAALTGALLVLLALVGFNLRFSWNALRTAPTPVIAAVVGAVVAAPIFSVLTGFSLRAALATTLGFGFYTLAGPLVTTGIGPLAGLVAFLTNFFRENLTMVTAPGPPDPGRRVDGDGRCDDDGHDALLRHGVR